MKWTYLHIVLLLFFFQEGYTQFVEKSVFDGGTLNDQMSIVRYENNFSYVLGNTQSSNFSGIANNFPNHNNNKLILSKYDNSGNLLKTNYISSNTLPLVFIDFEIHQDTAYLIYSVEINNNQNLSIYEKYDFINDQSIFKDTLLLSTTPYIFSTLILDEQAKNVYITLDLLPSNSNIASTATNNFVTDTLYNNLINGERSKYFHYNNISNQAQFVAFIPTIYTKPILQNNKLYFNFYIHPSSIQASFLSIDALQDTILAKDTLNKNIEINILNIESRVYHNNHLYFTIKEVNTNRNSILKYDTLLQLVDSISLGFDNSSKVQYDGDYIYYSADSANYTRFKIFYQENLVSNQLLPKLSEINASKYGNYIHLVGISKDFPSTNATKGSSNSNALTYLKISISDYSICYSSYIGGIKFNQEYTSTSNAYLYIADVNLVGNKMHILGFSQLDRMPKTSGLHYANSDYFYTIFNTELHYTSTADTLAPKSQTVCKNGLAEMIVSSGIQHNVLDTVPLVYFGNSSFEQELIFVEKYQWQEATNINGPYTDIAGAIGANYLPEVALIDKFYRRITHLENCDAPLEYISDTASVLVNNNFAPQVNAGGDFYTCPNVAVTIGHDTAAINGTPPYSYNWSNTSNSQFTSVSPANTSIYTLTVTDNNGCKQYDQAQVYVVQSNAGPDVFSCAGDSVLLKGETVQGLSGVSYLWQGNNMCCPNSAYNTVNPPNNQTYVLTTSIPKSGGGFCSSFDTVQLTIIEAPNPNFAGPDQLLCLGDQVKVGIAPQADFTYHWAPFSAVFLPENDAEPILKRYSESNLNNYFINQFPSSNPLPVVATMTKQNCIFKDTAYIAFVEAVKQTNYGDPHIINCQADTIGHIDRASSIAKTFSWSQTSGDAQIAGVTNQSQLAVNTSTMTTTSNFVLTTNANFNNLTQSCSSLVQIVPYYEKTALKNSCFPIMHNGVLYNSSTTITDTIISNSVSCDTIFTLQLNIGNCVNICSYISNGKSLIDVAYNLSYGSYNTEWSVITGSSSNVVVVNTEQVEVLDASYRELKLKLISTADTSIYREYFIDVNGGSWNPMQFSALDTSLCFPTSTIAIGEASKPGYLYTWSGPNDFESNSSNPIVTPPNTGMNIYDVIITRGSCILEEQAKINVIHFEDDFAGTDYEICENAYITLGNPNNDETSFNYEWTPANAFWQNGTNEFSANPEILTSISTQFTVTISDFDNICSAQDTVNITVTNSPTLNIPDFDICRDEATQIGLPAITGADFVWSPAVGLSCTACNEPIVTLNSSQNYSVQIVFQGNCVNPNYTDMVSVNVIEAVSNMVDVYFCPDGSVVTIGTDAPSGMNNYEWNPGSLLTSPTTRISDLIAPNTSNTENYILSFEDQNACTILDTVAVIPAVSSPAVNAGNSFQMCLGQTSTIGQTSFDPTATYAWIPTTNLSNPNASFTDFTPSTRGVFVYTLSKTEASGLCTTVDEITIEVSKPKLNDTSYLFCQNSCELIGFTPEQNTTYSWSPSSFLSSANSSNPELCNATQNIDYQVTAVDANGCDITKTVSINLLPDFSPNININDTIVFTNSNFSLNPIISPTGNYNYQWNQNSFVLDANTQNGLFNIFQSGTFDFTLEVINPSTGCSMTDSASVTAVHFSDINMHILACDSTLYNNTMYYESQILIDSTYVTYIDINDSKYSEENIFFCDSIEINGNWFTQTTSFKDTFQSIFSCDSIVDFNLFKTNSSPETIIDTFFCSNENFSFLLGDTTISSEGFYERKLNNQSGCDSLVSIYIVEKQISLFDAVFDTSACLNKTLTLNPNALFGDSFSYVWENNSQIILEVNESESFVLQINHSNGCRQNIEVNAVFDDCINDCSLLLPTGFSPNNDGVNDELVVFNNCYFGIESFTIKIFNRWGEMVFASDDMDKKWDGNYKNQAADIGIYTYTIEYKKTYDDTLSNLSGNITLIR